MLNFTFLSYTFSHLFVFYYLGGNVKLFWMKTLANTVEKCFFFRRHFSFHTFLKAF